MFYIILILFLTTINSNLCELIFEDNFDNSNLSKWEVYGSDSKCIKMFSQQLSCNKKSHDRNIMMRNGTVVLTTIHEKFLNHSFTSASIITKQSFKINLTKSNIIFKIRASMPITTELFVKILLVSDSHIEKGNFSINLAILKNVKYKALRGFTNNFGKKELEENFLHKADLKQFQNYEFEITREQFIWSMNGTGITKHVKKNYRCNCSLPYSDHIDYRLVISTYADESLSGGFDLVFDRNADKWFCTSMIIDYVKVFRNQSLNATSQTEADLSAHYLCGNISKKIFGRKNIWDPNDNEKTEMKTSHMLTILLISTVLCIFFVALLFTLLSLRKTKRKYQKSKSTRQNVYEQIELPDIVNNMKLNSIYSDDNGYEYINYQENSVIFEQEQECDIYE